MCIRDSFSLDASPKRLGQEEVHWRDHFVSQFPHSKNDYRRLEIHVGRSTEHLTQPAVNPTPQHKRDSRLARQALGDVAQDWLRHISIGLAHRTFDERSL